MNGGQIGMELMSPEEWEARMTRLNTGTFLDEGADCDDGWEDGND